MKTLHRYRTAQGGVIQSHSRQSAPIQLSTQSTPAHARSQLKQSTPRTRHRQFRGMLLKPAGGQTTAYPNFQQAVDLVIPSATAGNTAQWLSQLSLTLSPLHAHPVQAGCKFIAEPLILCRQGRQGLPQSQALYALILT